MTGDRDESFTCLYILGRLGFSLPNWWVFDKRDDYLVFAEIGVVTSGFLLFRLLESIGWILNQKGDYFVFMEMDKVTSGLLLFHLWHLLGFRIAPRRAADSVIWAGYCSLHATILRRRFSGSVPLRCGGFIYGLLTWPGHALYTCCWYDPDMPFTRAVDMTLTRSFTRVRTEVIFVCTSSHLPFWVHMYSPQDITWPR